MDIQKIFAELGRLHLEIMHLNEQLTAARARIIELTPGGASAPSPVVPSPSAA